MNGSIPESLGQLSQLISLYLSYNSWEGILTESHFINLTRLQDFQVEVQVIEYRPMSLVFDMAYDWIPPFKLHAIKITNCRVGPSFRQLEGLSLKSNQLSGEFPHVWIAKSNILYLDVGQNSLFGNIPTSLGVLSSLTELKLNNNNFSSEVPDSLKNCSSLMSIDLGDNKLSDTQSNGYAEQATLTLKGRKLVYNKTLMLVKIIDLSSNKLRGEIPDEISSLFLLGTLNLSKNQLTGKIPSKIGNLHLLETLDLSHNRLSEQIPQSLSSLTFLSHLNLSYNNLSGRIPSGNQLQTLNVSSIYMENPLLCGVPLSNKCPEDNTFPAKDAKDKNEGGSHDKLWFYVNVILGFIVGFWSVCGTLILKTSWRYAYFQFFDDIKDKVALGIALEVGRFQRMFSDV
ncbi:hypothetical protein ACFX2F_036086 [Malus domestica]